MLMTFPPGSRIVRMRSFIGASVSFILFSPRDADVRTDLSSVGALGRHLC